MVFFSRIVIVFSLDNALGVHVFVATMLDIAHVRIIMKVMFFLAKQRHRFNGTLTDSISFGKGKALRRTLRIIILGLRSVIRLLIVLDGQKDLYKATDLRDQFFSTFLGQVSALLLEFLVGKILNFVR